MTNVYKIDYDKLVVFNLPIAKRKKRLFEYLAALLRPVRVLYADFKKYRDAAIYKVEHTSQVWSMAQVLNDTFDPVQRRIYIEDAYEGTPVYIYRRSENKPVYIYRRSENQPVYIYRRNHFTPNETDALILIPLALKPISTVGINIVESQIKEKVNYYRTASKRFEIVWI